MKILIDIMHIPHINFLKNAVAILKQQGHEIKVICLDRGRNISIAKEEFLNVEVMSIGKHKGTFGSIIFQANVLRFFLIFKHLLFNRYDVGLSVGGFLTGFGLKLFQKPNLQFYDDPENRKNLFFQRLTATKLFYPSFHKEDGILNFNALKEWAYLSPKYFKPSKKCLDEYNLEEKEYIFIREVSYTTNYAGQSTNIISTISKSFPSDKKVVLSLENKDKRDSYPNSWILLNEPVSDIHSLMFHSSLIISSGDSMAREGAMLGVPSIYCGIREMAANKIMIEKEQLFHLESTKIIDFMDRLYSKKIPLLGQNEFREKLMIEWDDVTELIVNEVSNFNK